MVTKIHLIRHGITEGNKKRWYYGAMDLPLDNEGVDEVVSLALDGIYPAIEGCEFYTTGMLRTEQTLFLIYGDVRHKIIEELREMKFGIFEGFTYDEIKDHREFQRWIEEDDFVITEGESRLDFVNRVSKGFEKLLSLHQLHEIKDSKEVLPSSLIVCHGGVIGHLMNHLFPNERNFFQWIPSPGMGYTLLIDNRDVVGYEVIGNNRDEALESSNQYAGVKEN